ncbi:XRE family transcriptional regulator [Caldalkalibacillus thermarum]|uniref:helix-turn-helix domain-containing protein n=1 Tax=Caldalkalibacillus thermarum TaxID=296745 RepID=UPI00166D199C|nr:helix-turn-helix transcriptional regulator [Caldalkalibacillus thermarum]GGK32995.1 XRE family transcriptional regulator [Caldalkalibacillus thermarum]
MNIGKRIRELRLSKDMKVIELAKKAHISQPYLSDIEKGRTTPSIDKLSALCDALGISLGEFFGYSPELPPDLLQLLETAKKLSPEERKALNEYLKVRLKE